MPGSHPNSHSEKYYSQMLIGFVSIIGFVLITFYSIFELKKDKPWYFWALVAGFLLIAGIYFCLSAFVHKIKSDFNRRAKQREQHKTFMTDN
ncbi:MAG: hypothetical protein HYZ15_12005 [Sphingobacteriales bacterium]|nr:hypothetical protein [Sphingobacteriales bacterium]